MFVLSCAYELHSACFRRFHVCECACSWRFHVCECTLSRVHVCHSMSPALIQMYVQGAAVLSYRWRKRAWKENLADYLSWCQGCEAEGYNLEDLLSVSNPSWEIVDDIPVQIEVGPVYRSKRWGCLNSTANTQRGTPSIPRLRFNCQQAQGADNLFKTITWGNMFAIR